MRTFSEKTIQNLVNRGAKNGFTSSLGGEIKRYVVAYTNNTGLVDIAKLYNQARKYLHLENINVGGWTDKATNVKYIDISTSFNSEEKAIEFAVSHNQIAIWDTVEEKEIRL